ncbi:MAG: hypothetical protein V8R80_09885 [Eubacterium sp.]
MACESVGETYIPVIKFVGIEKFLMGNISDGVQNTEVRNAFK